MQPVVDVGDDRTSQIDRMAAAAMLLQWNAEFGVDEVLQPAPVVRNQAADTDEETGDRVVKPAQASSTNERQPAGRQVAQLQTLDVPDPALARARSTALAAEAMDLDGLRRAIDKFEHCEFRVQATNMVFSDGNPEASLMIVGEAPGKDEDLEGRPFVGRSGKLLDRMYGEIGLSRDADDTEGALYITNVVNWRPEGNRQPTESEIAMFRPFVMRHIELVRPRVLALHGNPSCMAIIRQNGITRLRGKWFEHDGTPVMPMFHPAYLLRNPTAKRQVWNDLLMIKQRLREMQDG